MSGEFVDLTPWKSTVLLRYWTILVLAAISLTGCRTTGATRASKSSPVPVRTNSTSHAVQQVSFEKQIPAKSTTEKVVDAEEDSATKLPRPRSADEQPAEVIPLGTDSTGQTSAPEPDLPAVVASVRNHFPLIRQAAANRVVASGEALSASGAFDHKLEGFSNAQPLDFYMNHWHKWGIKRDTMWGGQIGAGYRLGRGDFEPWYKERQTDGGGEFSLSLMAPIGRDRWIDSNRAELWRAQLERDRVEPFIRAQVIQAVNEGARSYWQWVAAGVNLQIAENVLQLGVDRVDFLQRQVELGEKADIDLVDNQRVIVSRQAKVIDARRKLRQAAVKLSLYLRDDSGQPQLLDANFAAKSFPGITLIDEAGLLSDVSLAQANRPELNELQVVRQQLSVALRQACNETRADIDTGLYLAQDVGKQVKDKDKSEFQLDALLTVSVPLERRRAQGKVRQLRGKLAQLRAKTQFASEKISAEVQLARAALTAAAERVEQINEALVLTERMEAAERRLYEEGQSTLFNLNLRELQTAEAAAAKAEAQFDYFVALADYAAALGLTDGQLGLADIEPLP